MITGGFHKAGKWFISFKVDQEYWLFAFQTGRTGWYYFGTLPNKPWTSRYRIGPLEFEIHKYSTDIDRNE